MSADRTAYSFAPTPEEVEDAEAILRDLEEIIYETFPPDQAEAAYIAALEHLLKVMGGEAVLATDRLFERVMRLR